MLEAKLSSAANPADERVSIGARALTGDAYLGQLTWPEAARALLMYHVFWDTEIYLLPSIRFHALGGARAKAARMGWRGALYAWESADTGEETTPEDVIGPNGQVIHARALRQSKAAHQRGCSLCRLAVLAGDCG